MIINHPRRLVQSPSFVGRIVRFTVLTTFLLKSQCLYISVVFISFPVFLLKFPYGVSELFLTTPPFLSCAFCAEGSCWSKTMASTAAAHAAPVLRTPPQRWGLGFGAGCCDVCDGNGSKFKTLTTGEKVIYFEYMV